MCISVTFRFVFVRNGSQFGKWRHVFLTCVDLSKSDRVTRLLMSPYFTQNLYTKTSDWCDQIIHDFNKCISGLKRKGRGGEGGLVKIDTEVCGDIIVFHETS